MMVVIPKLSSNPSIYGIYVFSVSMTIFLQYADIGIYKACYKYAAEYYALGDRDKEYKILGFTIFVMGAFITLIASGFLYLSYHPELVIKDINGAENIEIAHKLFMIMSIFSYMTVFQKINALVYGIRVEDYRYQRLLIIASTIKIISVFYFFNESYDIVGYLLFFNLLISK